jgi:hypothetical protein
VVAAGRFSLSGPEREQPSRRLMHNGFTWKKYNENRWLMLPLGHAGWLRYVFVTAPEIALVRLG